MVKKGSGKKTVDPGPKRGLVLETWHLTNREAAPIIGCSESSVSYMRAHIVQELGRDYVERFQRYDPPPRTYPESLWDLTEDHLGALLEDFLSCRRAWFKTPSGEPFLTEPFHQHWIESFLRALVNGERLVILSPPRHGKTELLIHFCTWLIVRFPMTRILWVGGNETIAKRSVAQVQAQLTTNQELIANSLPPEFESYRPDRKDGLPWTKSEFTVSTRPFPIKGTSMTALGRGGTLLSLDADLIVADDIEDHKTTIQPAMRESTREWWTSQLESRKEEHTALVLIGSRQHPDDLAGHLLGNEAYTSIVETAHQPTCTIPDEPDHYPEHVDCMLFPAIRSYKWLMAQRKAADTTGGRAFFEMVYLNLPYSKGMVIFTPEIVNRGLDRGRVIGDIPPGTRLIAGLDPSGLGYQAAFLWAARVEEPFKIYMVDIDNNQGGGVTEAQRIMSEWADLYGLREWVVEESMWASGISKDHILMNWAAETGISIEGHLTFVNKWDDHIGVSQFVRMYLEDPPQISLPYGDTASQVKTDAYRAQLIYFSSAKNSNAGRNAHKGTQSDLVMASWFPMDKIRRAHSAEIAEMGVDYSPAYSSFGQSGWSTPPWSAQPEDEYEEYGIEVVGSPF